MRLAGRRDSKEGRRGLTFRVGDGGSTGPAWHGVATAAKQVGLLGTMPEKISGLQDPARARRGQKQPCITRVPACTPAPRESEHRAFISTIREERAPGKPSRARPFRPALDLDAHAKKDRSEQSSPAQRRHAAAQSFLQLHIPWASKENRPAKSRPVGSTHKLPTTFFRRALKDHSTGSHERCFD